MIFLQLFFKLNVRWGVTCNISKKKKKIKNGKISFQLFIGPHYNQKKISNQWDLV